MDIYFVDSYCGASFMTPACVYLLFVSFKVDMMVF